MSNLLTLISIAMAVTGGTYASIHAIRQLFYSDIRDRMKKAEDCARDIREACEGQELQGAKDSGFRHKTKEDCDKYAKQFARSYSWWQRSLLIPVALFSAYAYATGVQVCVVYFTPLGATDIGGLSDLKWLETIHVVVIMATLLIDIATLLLMWSCRRQLREAQEELQRVFESIQPRLKRRTPNHVIGEDQPNVGLSDEDSNIEN